MTKRKKWKVIHEVERYKIETLLKERYKPKETSKSIRFRIEELQMSEIQRGKITKKQENPYVSRNPPDQLEKIFYSAKVANENAKVDENQ